VFESVNFFLKTLPYISCHNFLLKDQNHKRIFGGGTLFHPKTFLSPKCLRKNYFTMPKWTLKSAENDKLVFESVNFFLKTLLYIFSHNFLLKGQNHKRILWGGTSFHPTTFFSPKFFRKSYFTMPKWTLKSAEIIKNGF